MQTRTQSAAPVASQAPTPLAPPEPVSITVVGADGKTQTITIPTTSEQVANLEAQREELAKQLTSVSERRSELVTELQSAPDGASRVGLEARLKILDQRILQLENDLASTGRQISSAPAALIASSESVNAGGEDYFAQGAAVGAVSTLFILAIGYFFARGRGKRGHINSSSHTQADSARLERLEHGMEAIAIEMERVSEGQRFVTRLLSESQPPLGTSHRIGQPAAVQEKRST